MTRSGIRPAPPGEPSGDRAILPNSPSSTVVCAASDEQDDDDDDDDDGDGGDANVAGSHGRLPRVGAPGPPKGRPGSPTLPGVATRLAGASVGSERFASPGAGRLIPARDRPRGRFR